MPLKRTSLYGGVFAALCALLLALWWMNDNDLQGRTLERAGPAASPLAAAAPAMPAPIKAQPFTSVEPPEDCIRLRVLSRTRQPIAGALAAWMRAGERGRSVRNGDLLRTGADGCVDIPWQADFGHIAVSHAEHGTAQVTNAVSGRCHEVVLPGGLNYRVFCHTPSGQPIRGVRIMCSGSYMASNPKTRELDDSVTWVPGGIGETAIRAAWTDASGATNIGGLEAGTWYVMLQHNAFVAMDKVHGYPVELHDNLEEQITMAPILLAVARVEDDTGKPIAAVCTFNDQRFADAVHYRPETGRIRELRLLWSRRFPESHVFATIPPSVLPDAITPTTVETDVLVPGSMPWESTFHCARRLNGLLLRPSESSMTSCGRFQAARSRCK